MRRRTRFFAKVRGRGFSTAGLRDYAVGMLFIASTAERDAVKAETAQIIAEEGQTLLAGAIFRRTIPRLVTRRGPASRS